MRLPSFCFDEQCTLIHFALIENTEEKLGLPVVATSILKPMQLILEQVDWCFYWYFYVFWYNNKFSTVQIQLVAWCFMGHDSHCGRDGEHYAYFR